MITRAIAPAKDELGIFTRMLGEITAQRLHAKRAMRESPDPLERSRLDAMQSSLKILINSFYGYLGYGRALFNDYRQADAVTQTGQTFLRQIIAGIRERAGKVIEVDTDGVFFVPPAGVEDAEQELAFVSAISGGLPEGISLAVDGRYKRMLSYKKKNYALLGYDQRITVKGSSLVSRSMERFGRNFVRQCIERILNHDVEGVHKLYLEVARTISARRSYRPERSCPRAWRPLPARDHAACSAPFSEIQHLVAQPGRPEGGLNVLAAAPDVDERAIRADGIGNDPLDLHHVGGPLSVGLAQPGRWCGQYPCDRAPLSRGRILSSTSITTEALLILFIQ